jgi:transposase-like protein
MSKSDDLKIGRDAIENWQEKFIGPGKEIEGSHMHCPCPYCGKINVYVTDGVNVARDEVITFERPCQHCQKTIFYEAELTISVTAKAPGVVE